MLFAYLVIVSVSLLLQLGAVWLAVRLVRVTGSSWAWIAIAAAMMAMAIRRVVLLVYVLYHPGSLDTGEFWSEVIGLLNAVLMLAGVMAIKPLFYTIRQSRDAVAQSNDRLELEFLRQNAELAAPTNN